MREQQCVEEPLPGHNSPTSTVYILSNKIKWCNSHTVFEDVSTIIRKYGVLLEKWPLYSLL